MQKLQHKLLHFIVRKVVLVSLFYKTVSRIFEIDFCK
jgi:hypothetical protein